jgi:hypothetical protein
MLKLPFGVKMPDAGASARFCLLRLLQPGRVGTSSRYSTFSTAEQNFFIHYPHSPALQSSGWL